MKEQTVARCDASSVTPLLVLAAALSGMALSSWQRKSFHLQCSRPRLMLRHAAGGLLMGIGEALIPGGNDGLILFGIPSLSPHAIPAYAGVLAGVATALLTLRGLVRNDLIYESEQSVIIDPLLVSPHLSKESAAREQNSTLPSQSPASIGSRRTRP